MKKINIALLVAAFFAATSARAADAASAAASKPEASPAKPEAVQPANPAPSKSDQSDRFDQSDMSAVRTPKAEAATPAAGPLQPEAGTTPDKATETPSQPSAPAPAAKGDPDHLIFNFHGVPLEMVLNYMSEAAGYVINVNPGTSIRGKIELWSAQPLTRDEALNALDTALNQNHLAAIRNGRTLSIVSSDEAKVKDIPVITESDPNRIPRTDQVCTYIIPVRFVEVAQLIKDIQPLVSLQSTITANDSGNAVVITDTQANIHRVAEIIRDIDAGAEDITVVRVIHLTNADPTETADLITSLFPSNTGNGTSQAPMQFGGLGRFFGGGGFGRFGGGGGGGFGGAGGAGGGTGSNAQSQRIKKRTQVMAVADQRTSSIVVTATKDLIDQIESVVKELDDNNANITTVSVIPMEHVDPTEAMQVLQDIFNKNGTQNSRTANSQNSALGTRQTSQTQQYNSNSRGTSTGNGLGRTGGGGGAIGFGQ